jgi:long-subunit acyl-CoA synthetase (AMP-forming)
MDTLLNIFKRNVTTLANRPFLGTREQLPAGADGKVQFGDYTWQTWGEIDAKAQKLAKGFMVLDLCPEVRAEDKDWRFVGIWAKNRWEWTTTLLAAMHYKITTVGFYDAMSNEQVDFILN